jgi:MFS family permease
MNATTNTKKVNYWNAAGVMALIGTCIVIALSGASIGLVNAMVTRFKIVMDISTTDVAYAAMVITALGALFAGLGTRVIEKLTPRICLILGCICEGVYMIITGTTTSYAIFVASGILGGIGMGLGTIAACVGIADQFFGEKSGKITGIFIFTMMLGTSMLTMLAAFLLETVEYGAILVGMGITTAVGGTLINLIFIRKPSPEVQAHVAEMRAIKTAERQRKQENETGFTAKEAVKKSAFWFMAFGMFFGAVILAYFATYSAVFFVDLGMELTDATRWRSAQQFFCALNVLWVGFFAAKFGPKKYLAVIYGAIIVGCFLFLGWIPLQMVVLLAPAIFLTSFDQCTTAAPANILPPVFGRKDYTGINSAMMGFYYAGVFFSQITSARILDLLGGYASLVWLAFCSALSLVFFLLALGFSPMKKLKKSQEEVGGFIS